MEARELRIGNLIGIEYIFNQYEDSISNLNDDLSNYEKSDLTKIIKNVIVKEIRDNELVVIGELCVFEFGHFKPIRLTEDWLNKFGFIKTSDKYNFEKEYYFNGLRVRENKATGIFHYEETELKYVHKLQNLYYALKELELVLAINPL